MSLEAKRMTDIIEPAVNAAGYELLGVDYFPHGRNSILRVYIDSPNGINIDDCEKASRQISSILDVEDPIHGKYQLEVSSPGIDRPLFKIEHYQQQLNHSVKIKLRIPINGQKHFKGKLLKADASNIQLECETEIITISYKQIQKGRLLAE